MQKIDNRRYIEEDEIDLRELFRVLWARRKFIIVFTLFITLLAVVYAFVKPSVYSGNVVIEIGEVINNEGIIKKDNKIINIFYLDSANNLKEIISSKFPVSVSVPKRTNNIIRVSYQDIDINKIDNKLNEVVDFIKERHKNKAKFYFSEYSKIKNTEIISKKIGTNPIKPKKKLIVVVAFITGFILSIFLVFFIEFIKGFQEEDKR